jgi:bifunctional UDP-N-acetylglucosamine pyrophosphorylase/glucosamine-1-phosphate N-acetyltransferase
MIWWSVNAAREATSQDPYVVIGPEAEDVRQVCGDAAHFIVQEERLGTAHAVRQAAEVLQGTSDLVLVTNADMPLLRPETLRKLIEMQGKNSGPLTLLTATTPETRGFGRILRNEEGQIVGIIEEAHATPDQLTLQEVNVGAYCFNAAWLWDHLPQVTLSPRGEYYLTDLIGMAVRVANVRSEDADEIIGVNNRAHLAAAEAALRRRINRKWMEAGVTILDPDSTYIEAGVQIGKDTTIFPGTYLQGRTTLGEDCKIGPNTVINESSLGDRCEVHFSVVEKAILEEDVDVGPFAHLRSGAHLCAGVHMGNFGEVKNSKLGPGVKMGHVSYVGDATIGADTNIGAGTVTCNFDGERKHPTEIGEGVFIGSDTMLVAPIRLGAGSRTGAGSVVTKDVPAHTLVVGAPARAIRKLKEESDE